MSEELIYNRNGVRISRTIAEMDKKQYQIRNINGISIAKKSHTLIGLLGLALIFCGVAVFTGEPLLGVFLVGIGIAMAASMSPTYTLMFDTSNGSVAGYSSKKKDVLVEIRDAIDEAMARLN